MSWDSSSPATPTFPPGYRASGLLLPLASLPSPHGIGDFGPSAYAWIDRLHESGQSWWQILPLGPTGAGNSPYQCLSSFASSGLLISPDLLIEDGLLGRNDCVGAFSNTAIDYEPVIRFKRRLRGLVWSNFQAGFRKDLVPDYESFCAERAGWLDDYALFHALKAAFNGSSYLQWPADFVRRKPDALAAARQQLANEIDQLRLEQFLLSRQASRLKRYARAKGVRLIGDLPFFVSPDSSDVWANPEYFLLDRECRPQFVSGVPPDYFSATGQLWGSPVYDWRTLHANNYRWSIDRIRALLANVDVIRLDHFRAFVAAWHIRAGSETALQGEWVPGPGAGFFNAVQAELGCLPFIAEDLGTITPEVAALRDDFDLPGTRVLQFAFDSNGDNPHLPRSYPSSAVVYTGTHDNPTTREWFGGLSPGEQQRVSAFLKRSELQVRGAAPELIRMAWRSPAALAIAPLQDVLNLGHEGRMNVPGRPLGNWRWRVPPHMLEPRYFRWLQELTAQSARSARVQLPAMGAGS